MTEVVSVDAERPDPESLERAAVVLRRGGLVAFPTETVYGLGAHALDPEAVARIFTAKGRPGTDPLIVHVPDLAAASRVAASIPPVATTLADRFWPGPLTLILPKGDAVPPAVTAGLGTVAVRVPAHPVARALLASAGVPIAAPSANLFSRPSPTTAAHVLRDLDGRIDMVVDGGPTPVGIESTVLDLTAPVATILRPGAVTLEMLRAVIPDVQLRQGVAESGAAALPSPGLLSRHYAPRAPFTVYEGPAPLVLEQLAHDARLAIQRGDRVGILAADEDRDRLGAIPGAQVVTAGPLARSDLVAARLYAALRELDALDLDLLLGRGFPATDGLGLAVRDRLRRAASGRVIQTGR